MMKIILKINDIFRILPFSSGTVQTFTITMGMYLLVNSYEVSMHRITKVLIILVGEGKMAEE